MFMGSTEPFGLSAPLDEFCSWSVLPGFENGVHLGKLEVLPRGKIHGRERGREGRASLPFIIERQASETSIPTAI